MLFRSHSARRVDRIGELATEVDPMGLIGLLVVIILIILLLRLI